MHQRGLSVSTHRTMGLLATDSPRFLRMLPINLSWALSSRLATHSLLYSSRDSGVRPRYQSGAAKKVRHPISTRATRPPRSSGKLGVSPPISRQIFHLAVCNRILKIRLDFLIIRAHDAVDENQRTALVRLEVNTLEGDPAGYGFA